LRSVDIAFESRRVLPGDTLSGKIIIRTDKSFDCNRVVLKFRSRERTEHGSGDHRTIDEEFHLSRVFRISEGRTIPEGNTPIPFSFQVPRGLPPSYNGYNGDIKHTIEAVVEVDWALDPKMKREYRVLQPRPPYLPEVVDTKGLSKEDGVLRVELYSNILRMDSGILVRFQLGQRKRMERVRVDIRRREESKCSWHEMKHDSNVRRKFIEIGEDDWGRWKEQSIGEKWDYHFPFKSKLFHVRYYLEVTLEVGWDLDPSIKMPLIFSDGEPEQDVLDEIAMDLGFEDW